MQATATEVFLQPAAPLSPSQEEVALPQPRPIPHLLSMPVLRATILTVTLTQKIILARSLTRPKYQTLYPPPKP